MLKLRRKTTLASALDLVSNFLGHQSTKLTSKVLLLQQQPSIALIKTIQSSTRSISVLERRKSSLKIAAMLHWKPLYPFLTRRWTTSPAQWSLLSTSRSLLDTVQEVISPKSSKLDPTLVLSTTTISRTLFRVVLKTILLEKMIALETSMASTKAPATRVKRDSTTAKPVLDPVLICNPTAWTL